MKDIEIDVSKQIKRYQDAKNVIKNQKDYTPLDVVDAQIYINGYEAGYKQASHFSNVIPVDDMTCKGCEYEYMARSPCTNCIRGYVLQDNYKACQ